MSSQQRIEVWRGDRLKTSGGLFRKDLVKNKRGKIVSKKKSVQARDQNNLGDFLRKLNEKVSKADMLRPAKKAAPKKAAPKPESPKKLQKQQPKKRPTINKPKLQAPAVKPKKAPAPAKKKLPKGYNPITRQPYEKKSGLGYVQGGNINLDNIVRGKRIRKKRKL